MENNLTQATNNLRNYVKGSCLSGCLLLMLAFCSELFAAPVSYTYDNLNRLTSINYNNGQQITTYSYDPAGNLLSVSHSDLDTDGDGIIDSIDTDDDNDGLPDTWEILYGSNPLIADANLHSDNDGYSNLEEYLAGTDPTNNTSVPSELGFAGSAYLVNEADGIIGIPVIRTGGSAGAVSILCQTSDDTAEAGLDYTAVDNSNGWINWADGDSSIQYCDVSITADAIPEGNESFTVTLNNPTSGALIGNISTTTITIGLTVADDFNGDSKADILTRHSTTGQLYLDEMDGNIRAGSNIGGLSTVWAVAGIGDFGGDGKADILLRHSNNGQLYLYEMDGNQIIPSNIGGLSQAWEIAGTGDLGGDGKADIVLRNINNGQLYLYEMDGNQKTGSNIGGLSLGWDVAGIGDFGGDGKADILLRHSSSGQLYLYEMDGNQKTGSNIGMLALSWEVARIADYGGDGKADILIRNTSTGQLYLNEMNGNVKTGSNVGSLSTEWTVVDVQ